MFESNFKKLMCFVELSPLAMDFCQFVSRIGIGGIQLKLLLECLGCFRLQLPARIGLLRKREKRSTQAEMDPCPARVECEYLAVFSDCKLMVPLTFVHISCGLMHPNGIGRQL